MNNPDQKSSNAIKENYSNQHTIDIWIDDFDDIFSDFDSRSYAERNISDDFLYEVKRISSENEFIISELKLLIPQNKRNNENENIIIKRLHNHFKKNYQHSIQHLKDERRKGFYFLAAGSLMLILAAYISVIRSEEFYFHVFLVILEPAGWFISWTGLDKLFSSAGLRNSKVDFYTKLAKSKIVFTNI